MGRALRIHCPKFLKEEWAEGVQYAHVGSSTRIVVSGRRATVYDGGSPTGHTARRAAGS